VAFANVAVGATATSQWMPEGALHKRLVEAGKTLGTFRAVLGNRRIRCDRQTTTEKYVANVRVISTHGGHGLGRPATVVAGEIDAPSDRLQRS